MKMYSYLFALIKHAANEAHGDLGLEELHVVWIYDNIRYMIQEARSARFITNYQQDLLVAYLDRVWNGEDTDNGY